MTTPTPDLLYIAGVVYPDDEWELWDDGLPYRVEGAVSGTSDVRGQPVEMDADLYGSFNPRLDGSDRERLQALDVIVVADKLRWFKERRLSNKCLREDVLTAALLALMEGRK